MSIEVNQLTKRFGTQVAVDAITFQIGKGEIVGFLGPNGAGKSTTMRMLTGYLPPDSGFAKLAGHDIVSEGRLARRMVGYLPENNPLYNHMYVREYLDLIAGLHRVRQASRRIDHLVELTGLGPASGKLIGQLSRGYRQRVGIAKALIADPEVLILDEPTSGLDPNQLSGIRELIRAAGREKTVLLSTHIMQEVGQVCDRVVIIKSGSLVADEPVKTLLGPRTGSVLLRVEFADAPGMEELKAYELSAVSEEPGNRFVFEGVNAGELGNRVYRFAEETGNTIQQLSTVTRDLEEVFRELTADGGINNDD